MEQLMQNWWLVALRGGLGVLFGLVAFFLPGVTLAVLVAFFGAFALIDGLFLLFAGLRSVHRQERWWALVLQGVVGILAGVITLLWPAITALALLFLIAAWAIATGVIEIAAAIRLRKEIHNEWLLGLIGALSVLLGVLLVVFPGEGLLAWVWAIGAYALASGVLLLLFAFRLRRLDHEAHHGNHANA